MVAAAVLVSGVAIAVAAAKSHSGAGGSSRDGLLAFTVLTPNPADAQEGDPVSAIYVANTDGTGVRRLTSPCVDCASNPVWSPDGSKIAYLEELGTVWVMNADGSGKRRLCAASCLASPAWPMDPRPNMNGLDCQCMDSPTWSPDGRTIAFLTQGKGADWAVAAVRTEGSGFRVLFQHRPLRGGNNTALMALTWSPNGKRFAFDDGNGANVYLSNADGTHTQLLARDAVTPAWSPDGVRVLVEGTRNLRLVALAAGAPGKARELRGLPAVASNVAWSADGVRVAYVTNGRQPLRIADISTGGVRTLHLVPAVCDRDGGYCDEISWQPVHR